MIISGEDDDDGTETKKAYKVCALLLPLVSSVIDLSPFVVPFALLLAAVVLNCFETLPFCKITGILSL